MAKSAKLRKYNTETSKPSKVFLRNEILNILWQGNADIRTVDVHICKLRQKLGVHSIKTIKGIGYKISV